MLRRHLKRFCTDTRAAVAFEAVLITPALAWTLMASFVFFDAYRTYNTSVKATYAIADLMTRETNTLHEEDVEGLSNIFEHMMRSATPTRMRVSQICWDGSDYQLDWSHGTDGQANLVDSGLAAMEDRLPVMALNDRLIIVETFIPYQPAFAMGLEAFNFQNFTISRPRYASGVPFESTSNFATCT